MGKTLLILTLLSFMLSGCFWQEEEKRASISNGKSPKMLFNEAKDQISAGTMDTAIASFEKLEAAYPASKYSKQAKLEIAHALYSYEDYDLAIAKLNRYIKLYPQDILSTPYAYYLRGVISEEKSRSMLDDFITDNAQRDVQSVRDAFNYYLALIDKFPKTEYASEAQDRLKVLRNIIVRHELHVAIFYTNNSSPIAAINRCKFIIEKYPNSPSIPEALHLMAHNYDIIGAENLATDVRRVLETNYPSYKQKYNLED
jgi:outer membrane protein assembly factor BamD